jgi:hypothetical protein
VRTKSVSLVTVARNEVTKGRHGGFVHTAFFFVHRSHTKSHPVEIRGKRGRATPRMGVEANSPLLNQHEVCVLFCRSCPRSVVREAVLGSLLTQPLCVMRDSHTDLDVSHPEFFRWQKEKGYTPARDVVSPPLSFFASFASTRACILAVCHTAYSRVGQGTI